ncbi:MAG: MFS transporter [SAR324 cluster bacterium]|nr:MFS transporter [SAR324 cluster bacterium]
MTDGENAQRASTPGGDGPWLLGLCVARVGFGLVTMTYAATLPLLQLDWAMSASQAGLIHSAFHIGYLSSLFGVGFLADRFGAKRVFLLSSIAGAVGAFSFAVFAQDFLSGFFLYGTVALFAGGSYTPVLTLIAQRFTPDRRGRAIGLYIAASSAGNALSLFLSGVMVEVSGWRGAFYVTAAGPALGTALAFFTLRHTPNLIPPPPDGAGQQSLRKEVLANKPALLVIAGYTFHSWELLGMRAWLPAFLAASLAAVTMDGTRAASLAASLSALMMLVSMGGNILGGGLSDRWGRTTVMLLMGCASLVCSFTIGWLVAAPLWIVVAVGLVYHFTAIGDSPVYSTALTEVVSPRYLGAAYSLRSVTGFGAGVISPALFGLVLDRVQGGAVGGSTLAWGLAFASLGLGGLLGPPCIAWLRRLPESTRMAGGLR